jgi:hypothetical protein
MTSFPNPIPITLSPYPASVTLTIEIDPQGMPATVDVEILLAGTFIPTPVGFGDNFINGKITFPDISVNKGDLLISTTRVTSIATSDTAVTVEHTIDTQAPEQLSATIPSGNTEKFIGEFSCL